MVRKQFYLREFPNTPAVREELDRQTRARLKQLDREMRLIELGVPSPAPRALPQADGEP